MMAEPPIVTIAVPSYNQGCFLEQALAPIFDRLRLLKFSSRTAARRMVQSISFGVTKADWRAGEAILIVGRPRQSTNLLHLARLLMCVGSIALTASSAED